MRLGVVDDWIPGNFNAIDEVYAQKIADMGFTGIGAHFAGDPRLDESLELCQQISSVLAAHGIEIVQFWGSYPSLISPDDEVRERSVEIGKGIVKLAAQLGAQMASIRPTSMHPNSPWWAHPDNFTPATRQRLTDSLREIATACDEYSIPMALECHVTTTLDSPENIRDIIQATGSPWIKVNMDAVNFVKDIPTAYDTGIMINHLFDVLAPYVVTAHIKDVDVLDGHVVHIGEKIPGEGVFDFDTLFRRFEALVPDGYGFIEHLKSEEQVRQANTFVRGKITEMGITIKQ